VGKQVGIHLVLQVRDRRSRLLVHRRDAHPAHKSFTRPREMAMPWRFN
jgi:hypothetical protein